MNCPCCPRRHLPDTLSSSLPLLLVLQEFSSKSILFHADSEYQSILVFKSAQYGNVLVLDGVIQLTERDEFAYHEMMVHVPACSHVCPKSILIVGGGDGGVLREVCRHETVERIVLVEIDPLVISVAKKFFHWAAACFDDARVQIVHEDAAQFLADAENNHHNYDIILGDTSDPVGPAESLFQPAFYESMYAALNCNGIVCVQAECFWIHLDLISDLSACCCDIFDLAEYIWTMVPTYPCGQIGFILAWKDQHRKQDVSIQRTTLSRPVRCPNFVKDLNWYSPEMHQAAFTLPPFVAKRLEYSYPVHQDYEESEGQNALATTFSQDDIHFVRDQEKRVENGVSGDSFSDETSVTDYLRNGNGIKKSRDHPCCFPGLTLPVRDGPVVQIHQQGDDENNDEEGNYCFLSSIQASLCTIM